MAYYIHGNRHLMISANTIQELTQGSPPNFVAEMDFAERDEPLETHYYNIGGDIIVKRAYDEQEYYAISTADDIEEEIERFIQNEENAYGSDFTLSAGYGYSADYLPVEIERADTKEELTA